MFQLLQVGKTISFLFVFNTVPSSQIFPEAGVISLAKISMPPHILSKPFEKKYIKINLIYAQLLPFLSMRI